MVSRFGLPPAVAFVRDLSAITRPAVWHDEINGAILCGQEIAEPRHRRRELTADDLHNARFCRGCDVEARKRGRR